MLIILGGLYIIVLMRMVTTYCISWNTFRHFGMLFDMFRLKFGFTTHRVMSDCCTLPTAFCATTEHVTLLLLPGSEDLQRTEGAVEGVWRAPLRLMWSSENLKLNINKTLFASSVYLSWINKDYKWKWATVEVQWH